MNCCICGPVKNCGPYLNKVFENIEKIGSLFHDYKIVIYYDNSQDNTLQILKQYKKKNKKFKYYVNTKICSKYRTHNIAKGRNFCLKYIMENKDKYPYFIMMDFDDVNCKNCNPEIIVKYLSRTDWDGLSFNTNPKYYDIWGLSIYPYYFSYNHFNNSAKYYFIIQNYIQQLLYNLPSDKLLSCMSSFNGFSIYRTSKFINCYYDGTVRLDLIPVQYLQIHSYATQSPIIYQNYGHVDGKYEDCEHRSFHYQAINTNHAKIRISPEVLFY
jgi:hypothetical protein